MSDKRAFSFGGGRQSTAALVLAARGELDVDLFVFANVGNDAENPDTLAYIRDYSAPYARTHGVELVEVQRQFRDGRDPSLYQYALRAERSTVLPMRMGDTGAVGNRTCTVDWKIKVVARYLKRERGWPTPWQTQLGISWDEAHRMRDPEQRDLGDYHLTYPLIDLRLTVADCQRIVADAGLPEPPKSSCWFCPFHDLKAWAKLRLHRPDLFQAAADLEQLLFERRDMLGKDRLYMSNRLKPLEVAIPEGAEQLEMFEGDGACTSGYCWT
jgi:hypothetical protein